jgi:iron complex transport system substrate-binding protein
MIARIVGGLALVLAAAVLGRGAAAGEVRDMLGRRVALPDGPLRVVSLAPSATEIVYALGLADRLAGVTDYCDFPADAKKKPKIGGFYTPNFEVILTLKPDLILATSIEGGREETFRGIEALGVPVYVLRPVDFSAVLDSIDRVGRLLGADAAGARLSRAMREEADGIARALRGAPRPRVLYVLWGNPLIVPGRDTLITDLIQRAGGESVTGDEGAAYPRLSLEEAVARRPDLIVVAQHGETSVDRRLAEWQHLAVLPAVRHGRVHPIDGDLIHRPGPRIIDALRLLARMFHPRAAWGIGP